MSRMAPAQSQGVLFADYSDPAPFHRWAGNKRKYVREIEALLGDRQDFREPFLGSGAVAFKLMAKGRPPAMWLNDLNPELIAAWQALREMPQETLAAYARHLAGDPQTTYMALRKLKTDGLSLPERGARFIFLIGGAHCGLWRENKKGIMNTPYGHASAIFTPIEDLKRTVMQLARVPFRLTTGTYARLFEHVTNRTVLFCDPPYLPLEDKESFTAYTGSSFTIDDHKNLASLALQAREQGARVLIHNHNTPTAHDIYRGAGTVGMEINAKRGFWKQGGAKEILFIYDV